MSPWVHLHIWPDGKVFPCCMTPLDLPVGNLKNNSIQEVANSAEMRQMRLDLMNDRPSPHCVRCIELEKNGSGSLRQSMNSKFGSFHEEVTATKPDGSIGHFKMRYWDIRFSNICNFKCRTCGPDLSSSWYEDSNLLVERKDKPPKVISLIEDEDRLWSEIEEQVQFIEEVYFVGGEPMLMEEHWKVLDWLIQKKLNDKVVIRYNTNFSFLKYKNHDVIHLWNQFRNVQVGASLDSAGVRGEYLRKGQNWKRTIENRERLMSEAPHVQFSINATVSAINVLHLPDFHKEWVDLGLIKPNDFFMSLLLFPEYYRVQILPSVLKEEVRQKYLEYIEFMKKNWSQFDLVPVLNQAESVLNFMSSEDRSDLLKQFKSVTNTLDKARTENILESFPELSEMFS